MAKNLLGRKSRKGLDAAWARWAAGDLLVSAQCPLCEAERKHADAYLDTVLWEQVTDPGTRTMLRTSRGWCWYHYSRAYEIAKRDSSASSIATIYADVLHSVTTEGSGPPAPRSICNVCCMAADSALRAADHLARALDDDELLGPFENSGPPCLGHLPLVQRLPQSQGRQRLVTKTMRAFEELAHDLQDYSDRQVYDYEGDRGDRGALKRLGLLVRGTYPGATANQCRPHSVQRRWYQRLRG